jgi:hypothetical protein
MRVIAPFDATVESKVRKWICSCTSGCWLLLLVPAVVASALFLASAFSRRDVREHVRPLEVTNALRGPVRLYPSSRPVGHVLQAAFVDAWDGTHEHLADAVVLVVPCETRPRAFPLSVLDVHELVLDDQGPCVVLVTYCGLTFSAAAYTSTDSTDVSRISDSGYLCESNLVLKDVETRSLWLQITGECIAGRRRGQKLREVSTQLSTLGAAVTNMPGLLILKTPPGTVAARGQLASPYSSTMSDGRPMFPVSHWNYSLAPLEPVVAFLLGERSLVIPLESILETHAIIIVDGNEIRSSPFHGFCKVELKSDESAWRELQSRVCYWFAWYAVRPDTVIIRPTIGISD